MSQSDSENSVSGTEQSEKPLKSPKSLQKISSEKQAIIKPLILKKTKESSESPGAKSSLRGKVNGRNSNLSKDQSKQSISPLKKRIDDSKSRFAGEGSGDGESPSKRREESNESPNEFKSKKESRVSLV
jgi:hypothetical protein